MFPYVFTTWRDTLSPYVFMFTYVCFLRVSANGLTASSKLSSLSLLYRAHLICQSLID